MTSPQPLSPGTFYHIFNRGINRENIFLEHRNYEYFMLLYNKYITPIADTFAYCLLGNHFHLLVYIRPLKDLPNQVDESTQLRGFNSSKQFSILFNTYAKSLNNLYQRTGSLFQHPFRRVEIMSQAHLIQVVRYIHQNPQKHGLVDDFRKWNYSSYKVILRNDLTFVKRATVLEWFCDRHCYEEIHAEWQEDLSRQILFEE